MKFLLPFLLMALPCGLSAQTSEWTTFNGDLAARKYSPAAQITAANVHRLAKVWEIHTGDVSDGSGDLPTTVWSATPIYANKTLYLGTPFYRILALDPATGDERWSYDSRSTLEALTQPALKNRGVTYWEAENPVAGEPCQKRVYLGTMEATIHAVDADTGERCADFGEYGILNVNAWNDVNAKWPLSVLQPPTAFGDQLFVGWAGKDWEYAVASPGTVFAVDARTGDLRWEVDFIPRKIRDRTGTANVWASMSVDEERGLLYLPVSSPSPNYYGGLRTEPIPLATSVTAVDVGTGRIVWSRQLIHHDIWDYDTNAAPTLVDLNVGGQLVPALVQTTKQSMLYVLNRETGEPVFDWEERQVPQSELDGEVTSATQPFAMTPPPSHDFETHPEMWWLPNALSFGACAEHIEGMRYEGLFTPPSLEGSILYPGTAGGMQWGGGALDPETNRFYVNTSKVVQTLRMLPRDTYEEETGDSGNEQGLYPQHGSPYGFELLNWVTDLGVPCWKPPYGTLLAYDLDTGELIWEVPFGRSKKWGFVSPESWGSPNIGAPVVTAGGVIFIGASMDARVRAIDPANGDVLWSNIVAAPSVANPVSTRAVNTWRSSPAATQSCHPMSLITLPSMRFLSNRAEYPAARPGGRILALCATAILPGCSGRQSVLNPAGEDAQALADLFWVMLAGATAIWLALAVLFIYVTRINPASISRRWAEGLIVGGGILFPFFVLAALLIWSLPLMPSHRAPGDGLKVEITAEQWWWRVEYLTEDGLRVTAANEVRLPADRRTDLELAAKRVIHSFWVPALGGKTDMLPGRVNQMSLKPLEPGLYRGQCAEYCGLSHALMAFETVVMPAQEFEAWLKREAAAAALPASEAARQGQAVFRAEGCGACHAIRGTDAVGAVGPDLTHFGSRHSIGAGILPHDPPSLTKWLRQTDQVKPGVEMPSYDHLSDDATADLVAYLMGLS